MTEMQWEQLQQVYTACRAVGVSFELHYVEGANLFRLSVSSAAKSENYVGKDLPFDLAVVDVMQWLGSLT